MTEIDDQTKKIRAIFRRELYVINALKINVFIDNDIMSAKNILIDLTKRIIKIERYKIIVSIKVKTSHDIAVQKSIHLRKIIVILSRFKQMIGIYHLTVFVNRDYFFEFTELNYLTIYVYMIDVIIKIVMMRNKFDIIIHILRKHRLNKVTELKLLNIYQIKIKS